MHTLQQIIDFGIPDETQDRGVYARAVRIVGFVIIAFDAAQRLGRFRRMLHSDMVMSKREFDTRVMEVLTRWYKAMSQGLEGEATYGLTADHDPTDPASLHSCSPCRPRAAGLGARPGL